MSISSWKYDTDRGYLQDGGVMKPYNFQLSLYLWALYLALAAFDGGLELFRVRTKCLSRKFLPAGTSQRLIVFQICLYWSPWILVCLAFDRILFFSVGTVVIKKFWDKYVFDLRELKIFAYLFPSTEFNRFSSCWKMPSLKSSRVCFLDSFIHRSYRDQFEGTNWAYQSMPILFGHLY